MRACSVVVNDPRSPASSSCSSTRRLLPPIAAAAAAAGHGAGHGEYHGAGHGEGHGEGHGAGQGGHGITMTGPARPGPATPRDERLPRARAAEPVTARAAARLQVRGSGRVREQDPTTEPYYTYIIYI